MLSASRSLKIIIILSLLTEVLYLVYIALNGAGNIPLYMLIYFEAFLFFIAAWFVIRRTKDQITVKPLNKLTGFLFGKNTNKLDLTLPLLIVIFGIIFRITLIPSVPATSPDVYRYMFEGRTTLSGNNPYVVTPGDKRVSNLADDNFDKVMFKELPAIYPPLSQGIFALSQFFTPGSYISIKIIFLLFDIMAMIFLLKLLVLKGKDPNLVLLYAWLPLPVMEYFANAHIDVAGYSFLIIFIYYLEKGKIYLSVIPFALSFIIKLYPVMLLPLLLKKIGFKKTFVFGIFFIVIVVLFYLPFVYNNLYVVESLVKYVQHWEFNGSVYNLIKYFSHGQLARQICAVMLIIAIAGISLRYIDFTKGAFGVFLAYVIFAATLYPWYLGWAAILNPFAGFTSIMSLFFTSNFSNFTPLGDTWKEYTWVLLVQYIPFFILLIIDLKKSVFRQP